MLRLSYLMFTGKIKARLGGHVHVANANANAGVEAVAGGQVVAGGAAVEQNVVLPDADVILAAVYPPVFHLHLKHHHKILTAPNYFTPHGVWEPSTLIKPMQQLIDENEVKKFQFDAGLLSRLNTLMPQIGKLTPERLIKREMNKHAKNIPFLTTPSDYAKFALDFYQQYQFAGLFAFIVQTIAAEGIGRDEIYLGLSWIGVRVNDLLRIANSFPAIQDVHGQVNLQLVQRSGNRYFLHEITMCLTRNGLPASRCERQPEVYLKGKKKTNITRDSYVFLFRGN